MDARPQTVNLHHARCTGCGHTEHTGRGLWADVNAVWAHVRAEHRGAK